jgi:hypothetical protein
LSELHQEKSERSEKICHAEMKIPVKMTVVIVVIEAVMLVVVQLV